jgi:hypothetical protein
MFVTPQELKKERLMFLKMCDDLVERETVNQYYKLFTGGHAEDLPLETRLKMVELSNKRPFNYPTDNKPK